MQEEGSDESENSLSEVNDEDEASEEVGNSYKQMQSLFMTFCCLVVRFVGF